MTIRYVPQGQPVLSPYLVVKGAARAIEFYGRAFGAREVYRLEMPGGRIGHAELRIGESCFMVADEFPENGVLAPAGAARPPLSLSLYVEDVDTTAARAVELGGTLVRPVRNEFYGDRTCDLRDPFGHRWHLATHQEDVSPAEMRRRMAASTP